MGIASLTGEVQRASLGLPRRATRAVEIASLTGEELQRT
jgi:hypothetical protein